jgi:hypothetical protein
MKVKYYMRGMGLGIVLTTLILAISNPKEKLTNQEIITRAQSLGMVMGEDNNKNLEEVLQNINPTKSPSELSATPAPTAAPSQAPTAAPTAAPTLAPTPVPTVEPMPTIKPTQVPVPTEIPTSGNTPDTGKVITFTIEKGMSSGKVAALLVQVGLVDNADDFNQFIEASGKASVIRVGSYSLPKDSTYEDIIKAITMK